MYYPYPRIIIAGISGDSGKTILSCGLLSSFRKSGMDMAPFKKGPDYIDPEWMSLASGKIVRNLDTYMMGKEIVERSLKINAYKKDISLIEGNRGLYDGFDAEGTHSTAELAKLLKAPVIIVFNPVKMTRTAAAIVLGCKNLDKDVNIAGVVLNQVNGARHLKIVQDAIENETGIPILGSIPKSKNKDLLPARHLGLVTPAEHEFALQAIEEVRKLVEDSIDINRIIGIAKSAPELDYVQEIDNKPEISDLKIGYFYDRAFSFYYQENLEALKEKGAELIKVSSIDDNRLPEIDALYIGGGFPETNADDICRNTELMVDLRKSIEMGLPVYAECGGLIYLSKVLEIDNSEKKFLDTFPVKIRMEKHPQGHGYMEVTVDRNNPYFPLGTRIKGHEFHYTKVVDFDEKINSCMNVERGEGIYKMRDGIFYKNVLASYIHIHALATPEWADGLIKQAYLYSKNRKNFI
jgi:cobyrinic acid a,c-diamide synthase